MVKETKKSRAKTAMGELGGALGTLTFGNSSLSQVPQLIETASESLRGENRKPLASCDNLNLAIEGEINFPPPKSKYDKKPNKFGEVGSILANTGGLLFLTLEYQKELVPCQKLSKNLTKRKQMVKEQVKL